MDYRNKAPLRVKEILCPRHLTERSPIPDALKHRPIVIAIAIHNQAKCLERALRSALEQTVIISQQATILILDDRSTDDWAIHNTKLLSHPSIAIIEGHCGSPARARNALLDFVDEHFQSQWVCRLDADDQLATPHSVEALCSAGDKANAQYVIGSNALELNGQRLSRLNIADPEILLNRANLTRFVRAFCLGDQKQELPSCNLALATHTGYRYPNMRSAEDHCLVAELLMFHPEQGHIVPSPLYAVYTLSGRDTQQNQRNRSWQTQRERLAHRTLSCQQILDRNVDLLGAGHEGIVWREGKVVHKRFYPWAMEQRHVDRLSALLDIDSPHFLRPVWYQDQGLWHCKTPYQPLSQLTKHTPQSAVEAFLRHIYQTRIAPLNIKRTNLMLNEQCNIVLIDIGKDIVELNVSRFLDLCARMYSIGLLGWSDEEVLRRLSKEKQDEALKGLPGFEDFYHGLILSLHPELEAPFAPLLPAEINQDTTLLIKACAQDAQVLAEQVQHIVSQLSYPQRFAQVALLLDPFPGPFLRQYAEPDWPGLQGAAEALKAQGWIDSVWIAPQGSDSIRALYQRWFGTDAITESHTSKNAPLFSQLWAFEQVSTRYLLQCDCDVLVGRKESSHDYLQEMLAALQPDDVLSVGFNIPKAKEGFREYEAQPGGYVPEVRMGLLDLHRIRQLLPLNNSVEEKRFTLTWHRAIERRQQQDGLRSLRGGDSRSFYVHPLNSDKGDFPLAEVRDLIAQGRYPYEQAEQFDLIPGSHWNYPQRSEGIVFLLKGSQTAPELIQRCLGSLRQQSDQDFGLIVIDDNADPAIAWQWPAFLGELYARTTLIRRSEHVGRGVNFHQAIEQLCLDPDTLIAVLDQDDALMGAEVVSLLRQALEQGADLIQLPMFRPDKPFKQYQPDYNSPRSKGGGEVWAHLRTFKKSLFERVPKEHLYRDDEWLEPSDYTTMLPMAELAEKPVFIDKVYGYYHQRQPYSSEVKNEQHQVLSHIMALPPLS
ncbi:glycosyltransferase family 2 protein [Ferrimonas balearica]|uniref:glycosyltransferase family 2 protein n=1 Tax=Ferrimonas balearica TaxID=44012 RepID=UPI001C58B8EF|nr:glycosyltransferase family 2 protein [Ferrimonas balearica]MBW3164592.1 glycosyltransferase [Ferrimonas balearica]